MSFLAGRLYVRCAKQAARTPDKVLMKPLLTKDKENGDDLIEKDDASADASNLASAPEIQKADIPSIHTEDLTPPPYEGVTDDSNDKEDEPLPWSSRTTGAYLRPLSK